MRSPVFSAGLGIERLPQRGLGGRGLSDFGIVADLPAAWHVLGRLRARTDFLERPDRGKKRTLPFSIIRGPPLPCKIRPHGSVAPLCGVAYPSALCAEK